MKRPQEIDVDMKQMSTMVDLTGVFRGIASLRIAQIKNQVLQSQQFFHELWDIYTQIRVDNVFRFGRQGENAKILDKELFIVITAEGGFSGEIDQQLIELMLRTYDRTKHDIIVIGHHGAVQLSQRGISVRKYYKLPTKDRDINVTPIIAQIQLYRACTVYYQTYVSLMLQDVKQISLQKAVTLQGSVAAGGIDSKEIITEANYIFEPSTYAVVDHLERSMMSIMVSQLILESKLAQYASRFKAMSTAHNKAVDARNDIRFLFNRAKRAQADDRLKEIIAGLKKAAHA